MSLFHRYMERFVYGDYEYDYQLARQDRKTLSLTVMPNLRIILKCSHDTSERKIESFLKRKWFWMEKQLTFFKKYQRKIYKKEYVSGEGYLYLGRQYKLVVKKATENSVSLVKGHLVVYTTRPASDSRHNKVLVNQWFANKIEGIFLERFNMIIKQFNYKKNPRLSIREMKKRWGSYLNKGRIYLNPELIHAPKECIDYVIVHELCHLKYKNHNKFFWNYVSKKFPKWKKVKEDLNKYVFSHEEWEH